MTNVAPDWSLQHIAYNPGVWVTLFTPAGVFLGEVADARGAFLVPVQNYIEASQYEHATKVHSERLTTNYIHLSGVVKVEIGTRVSLGDDVARFRLDLVSGFILHGEHPPK